MKSDLARIMDYRRLGSTEINVSVIGFGASPLGNLYRTTDPTEVKRAIHFAIDQGINLFDVAPFYGLTLAEERLGEALIGHRNKVVLATKCGRDGIEEFDFSAKGVTSSLDSSLKRLRTDYVDLLQAHDVEFGDMRQVICETIPTLRRLQAQGKTRYIGITGYPLRTLASIAEAASIDTILSYCRYNLMITDMDDVLTPVTRRRKIGLINASALGMGVLTEQGAPDWHPASQELQNAGRKAIALCQSRGVKLPDIALRFAFDHADVACTLVGMSSQEHVQASLNALAARTDQALVEELRQLFVPFYDNVWPSGRSENHDQVR
jgi:L-galactose dehydrogenase